MKKFQWGKTKKLLSGGSSTRLSATRVNTTPLPDKGSKKSNGPNSDRQFQKKTALPTSTRDIIQAMDHLDRFHPKFDGTILTEPISATVFDQIQLFIKTSMRMETLNFFFFDKCPQAVFFFIKFYLEALEQPILDEEEVHEIFRILEAINPLDRIKSFQDLCKSNPNRSLIRHLFLFFHGIAERSSSTNVTLNCMVDMFASCIFRFQGCDRKFSRKRKQCTKFFINHAESIFPDEDEQLSATSKEEASGIPSVMYASRRLGTDGMLYLLELELEKIEEFLGDLDYDSVSADVAKMTDTLDSLCKESEVANKNHKQFQEQFTARFQEVSALINDFKPYYNNLDFQGDEL